MRPRPDALRPRSRPRTNDLASRSHGPRGLNIPGLYTLYDYIYSTRQFHGLHRRSNDLLQILNKSYATANGPRDAPVERSHNFRNKLCNEYTTNRSNGDRALRSTDV